MIKRKLYSALKQHLVQKEMTFLVGPRQAGKTTLMMLLRDDLMKNGQKTITLNLDIETDKQFFQSQAHLIQRLRLEFGNQKGFVFLDEIQRKENAGLFLKGIYDSDLPYKFIISGSGAIELKEKIQESLAGRKRMFDLSTLSFEEFVNFKTGYAYETRLPEFFRVEQKKNLELLEEYLSFGGYPRLVLAPTLEEKRAIMNDIYQSYIEKDIISLLRIKKSEDFSRLLKVLAAQIGRIVHVSELSRMLGISQPTLNEYIWYLQKTFILQKVTPYFRNIRKEIIKTPIFYFNDLGLRNYALGLFGIANDPFDRSFVFQNFVFLWLRALAMDTNVHIHYWRTKQGAEVDFIIEKGQDLIPVEAKYQAMKRKEVGRSFTHFIEAYHPQKAVILNLSLNDRSLSPQTETVWMPFWGMLEIF
ncbi:ATP-binding protein [Candidatus Peregrinibacteria bacterium]|nr:ATP-binding protein [Candidatus Peregrinibacteria bacterium]